MISINDFEIQKDCIYKEEKYSVRDNGAIMRYPKKNNKPRPLDLKWTFGKPDDKNGYMLLCGQRVHRIVAYAFLGEPQSNDYVVDHIDTNRRNNRPENLRWLTRLENVLMNPITKARIVNICGSIEAFLNNPSLLYGHERLDPNFKWMRTVTKEEGQATLARLIKWTENPSELKGMGLGEWVYRKQTTEYKTHVLYDVYSNSDYSEPIKSWKPDAPIIQSFTENAMQLDWLHPYVFPRCPIYYDDRPIDDYFKNLKKGLVFCYNGYGSSTVLDFCISKSGALWVLTELQVGFNTHGITKIFFDNGKFIHENIGVYEIVDEPEWIFDDEVNKDVQMKTTHYILKPPSSKLLSRQTYAR